jgi:hypothetical protein
VSLTRETPRRARWRLLRPSVLVIDLVIPSSFVIRASSFFTGDSQLHRTIASRRSRKVAAEPGY